MQTKAKPKKALKIKKNREIQAATLDHILEPFKGQFETQLATPPGVSCGCLLLDLAVGGSQHLGFPAGRVIEIHSPSAQGKTMCGFHILRGIQQQYNGVALVMDRENKFPWSWAKGCGLDLSPKNFRLGDVVTMEKGFSFLETTIRRFCEHPDPNPLGILYDTIAMSPVEKELQMGIKPGSLIGEASKAIYNGFRSMIQKYISDKKIWLIILNQSRADFNRAGWGGPAYKSYAEDAIAYPMTIRIFLSQGEKLYITRQGIRVYNGVEIEATVEKNCIYPPYKKARFTVWFDTGIDDVLSQIDWLLENKFLTTRGGRAKEDPDEKAFRIQFKIKEEKTEEQKEIEKFRIIWGEREFTKDSFYKACCEEPNMTEDLRNFVITKWREIYETP